MGDKYRSEQTKPLKNPLLSGAGSGFPFENFTGSALLVPVSNNDSSVLSGEAEVDSFVGQNVPSAAPAVSSVAPINSDPKPFTFFTQQTNSSDPFGQLGPPQPTSLQQPPQSATSFSQPAAAPSLPIQATYPRLQTTPGHTPRATPPPSVPLTSQVSAPLHPSPLPPAAQFTGAGFTQVPGINPVGTNQIQASPFPPPPYHSTTPLPPASSFTPSQTAGEIKPPNVQSIPLSGTPSTSVGASNTYRLGNQKPAYAQPPGLNFTTPSLNAFPPTSVMKPEVVDNALYVQDSSGQLQVGETGTSVMSGQDEPFQYKMPLQSGSSEGASVLPPSFQQLSQAGPVYRPVYNHWFFKKEIEKKTVWKPFSMSDSLSLEEAFNSTDLTPETVVPTDGGRYDINVLRRQRSAVYWEESPTEVRRCAWFYKGHLDSRFIPYDEKLSAKLEEEFKTALISNSWHRRIDLPNGEAVVLHGPNVIVHFPQPASPDEWGNVPEAPTKPRIVKRGVDEFDIDEGEPTQIDHVVFLVHGIGSVCDLRFRSLVEVVDDFRNLSLQLLQSHFRSGIDEGKVNRIEVIPVSWHKTLHGDDTGIDRKLKNITLRSIPKLRYFTNDTLLDILFYTSPVYCQTIMDTVGSEMNRLHDLFLMRNPTFKGGVSLAGHSLGSLILFDLLYHQTPAEQKQLNGTGSEGGSASTGASSGKSSVETDNTNTQVDNSQLSEQRPSVTSNVSYMIGTAGTGQPFITYPQLNFNPNIFFAMGSPIGMFVTVRGIETLGEDFHFPTCPSFFNIFHPFDPVAYRIETLINPDLTQLRPLLIPHHKGRKRMHLELKETMARVGADLKQKFMDSIRSTWNSVYYFAKFHRTDDPALEQEVDKVLQEEFHRDETESTISGTTESEIDLGICIGQLNGGRRIDYVLQEAPLESFNEYLFALGSHVCYWESEDTMLMILKEIYSLMKIYPDNDFRHHSERAEGRIGELKQQYSTSAWPAFDQEMPVPSANDNSSVIYTSTPTFTTNAFPSTSKPSTPASFGFHPISATGSQTVRVSPTPPPTTNPTISSVPASLPFGFHPISATGSQLPGVSPTPPPTTNPTVVSGSSTPASSSFGFHPISATGSQPIGMDPTAPISENKSLGPPPIAGFVKQAPRK